MITQNDENGGFVVSHEATFTGVLTALHFVEILGLSKITRVYGAEWHRFGTPLCSVPNYEHRN